MSVAALLSTDTGTIGQEPMVGKGKSAYSHVAQVGERNQQVTVALGDIGAGTLR